MVETSASGTARTAGNTSPEQGSTEVAGVTGWRRPGVQIKHRTGVRYLRNVKGNRMEDERGAGGAGVDRKMERTAAVWRSSDEQGRRPGGERNGGELGKWSRGSRGFYRTKEGRGSAH